MSIQYIMKLHQPVTSKGLFSAEMDMYYINLQHNCINPIRLNIAEKRNELYSFDSLQPVYRKEYEPMILLQHISRSVCDAL